MTATQSGDNLTNKEARNRLECVLTDVHFWVPVLVLLGGLLLLRFVR